MKRPIDRSSRQPARPKSPVSPKSNHTPHPTNPESLPHLITTPDNQQTIFRGLLEAVPDAMVVANRNGKIVLINTQTEKLFGYTREELLGQRIEMLVPESPHSNLANFPNAYFGDFQARPIGAALDLSAHRKDGSAFPVEISLSPMESEEGLLMTAVIRDVTERKKKEAKFRGLLEASPDAIVIANREGQIVHLNAQAEKLFGYNREELLGNRIELLIPKHVWAHYPNHSDGHIHDPNARSIGSELDLDALRKDGTEFPAEISLIPMEAEEGMLVTVVIRDVTERRQQLATLEHMNHQAQESNRMKSEFLANMSHELRTPLNSVIGFAELIHDAKAGPVTSDQKEFLGDILTSAHHLLKVINDILDLAKVEAGKIQFRPENVSLEALVKEVCGSLRNMAETKKMQLTVEIHPDVGFIETDPGRLKQVLYNYLSNALKFTPEGGGIQVHGETDGPGFFKISVEDNGTGIRTEDRGRLFVAFQQLDASVSKKYPGTGLGLALTKKIVEAMGGRVGLDNVLPQGNVFYAILPRKLPPAEISS